MKRLEILVVFIASIASAQVVPGPGGGGGGGGGATGISPSGDATGAADKAALQAAITASQTSGAPIQLTAGAYYINGALTVGGPITFRGVGQGTVINQVSTTANFFTLAYSTAPNGNNFAGSECLYSDFSLVEKSGVTPTAGYGFQLSNGGSGYLVNCHIERVNTNGIWQPYYFGTGLLQNWITGGAYSNCVSTIGMEFNTPIPGGDFFIMNDAFNSGVGGQQCSVQIDQSDTTTFGDDKLNGGAQIIFTRAVNNTGRIRFNNMSIEGLGSGCAVNFGTHGASNPPVNIAFTGGQFALWSEAFCDGATVSGLSDASYSISPSTILGNSLGVSPSSLISLYGPLGSIGLDGNGVGIGPNGTATINTPFFVNTGVVTGGQTNPVMIIAGGQPVVGADYSQILIDATGASANGYKTAGIGLRGKATGTQQDWILINGYGTLSNAFRFLDQTNNKDIADGFPNAGWGQPQPPMLGMQTVISSATTIAPTAAVFHVSGTTTVQTITAPNACLVTSATAPVTFACQITIIPDGIFSTNTSGNIALASTTVVSKALIMTYDPGTSKWYPSY